MGDLRELYQETILDHAKRPRNFRPLTDPSHTAEGHNPICGDRLTVFVALRDGRIAEATFQGSGCAISLASASLMTEALRGKSPEQAERAFHDFHEVVTGRATVEEGGGALGKLVVFSGVREFPVRVKCATLPWHTLRAALASQGAPISTE